MFYTDMDLCMCLTTTPFKKIFIFPYIVSVCGYVLVHVSDTHRDMKMVLDPLQLQAFRAAQRRHWELKPGPL